MRRVFGALAALVVTASACGEEDPPVEGSGWPNVVLQEQRLESAGTEVTVQPIAVGAGGAEVRVSVASPGGNSPCVGDVALYVDGAEWGPAPPAGVAVDSESAGPDCSWFFSQDGPAVRSLEVIVTYEGLPYVMDWTLP